MPQTLRRSTPIANKEHICNYCGCPITKGTQYRRATLKYDNYLYEWINHKECAEITQKLNMWDWVDSDSGLSSDEFQEAVSEYIYDNHYDNEKDNLEEEYQKLSTYEQIQKILEEDFTPVTA